MTSTANNRAMFTIGRLAHAAGLSITTIRYYQRRGLLQVPERPTLGGFRSYGEDDLARLMLIRRAQEMGFTLAEILELAGHLASGNCVAIKSIATSRIEAIAAQVRSLEKAQKTLGDLVRKCNGEVCSACPLVQQLQAGKAAPDAAPA